METGGFTERLAELVDIFGSQSEFARTLGIDRSSVNRWLNGNALPDITKLRQICTTSGVSADYLLGLTNRKVIDNDDVDSCDLIICIRNVSELTEARNVYVRGTKMMAIR